jgi:hypothetical protein
MKTIISLFNQIEESCKEMGDTIGKEDFKKYQNNQDFIKIKELLHEITKISITEERVLKALIQEAKEDNDSNKYIEYIEKLIRNIINYSNDIIYLSSKKLKKATKDKIFVSITEIAKEMHNLAKHEMWEIDALTDEISKRKKLRKKIEESYKREIEILGKN